MRRWPRASGWCRSAGHRSARLRAGAAGRRAVRCTPRALAEELGIGHASSCRAIPACCPPPACWRAPVEHEVAAAFPHRWQALDRGGMRARPARELDARVRRADARRRHGRGDVEITPLRRRLLHRPVVSSGNSARLDAAGRLARLYGDFLAAHDRVYGHSTARRRRSSTCAACIAPPAGAAATAPSAAAPQPRRRSARGCRARSAAEPVEAAIYAPRRP